MLSDKNNSDNINNPQINNTMNEIENHNLENNNNQRGFNIFLSHGVSLNELRYLRILFHLSYIRNSIINNTITNIDMSPQAIYEREENWLRAQINNNLRNYYNYNNYRRNVLIRNPSNNIIYVNDNIYRYRPRRYEYIYEPNINFLKGFILGMILNIFSLCIILISRNRLKFKIGLIFGMLLSLSIALPFILNPNIKYL